MNRVKTSYRSRVLSFSKIVVKSFIFLLLFYSFAVAQSSSPKTNQWRSVGGQMIYLGKHEFKTNWLAEGGQMYWKNDEKSSGIPASHSYADEVSKDVVVNKGQITLRGPGYLGRVLRTKGGPGYRLEVQKPGKGIGAYGLGDQEMYKKENKWTGKWVTIRGMGDVVDPSRFGVVNFVPADKTITIDIWFESPWCQNCVWTKYHRGHGYSRDQGIELELWFFPGEGGKVIVSDTPSAQFDKPKPGILYYTDKACK